jgi:hypothetical protein
MVGTSCSWIDAALPPESAVLGDEFGSNTVAAAVDLLAGAGIVVRTRPGDDPLVDVDAPGPLSLLRFQARNLALEANKGGGTLGADFDAYTEAGGGSPIADLIVGWAEERATPSAKAAAKLLGIESAPTGLPIDPRSLSIPGLVAALFLGDITSAATGDQGSIDDNVGAGDRDFCADVAAYLSASLEDTLDPTRDLDPEWLQAAIDRYAPAETDPQRLRIAIGATALMVYATSISRRWGTLLISNPLGDVHHRVGSDAKQFDPKADPAKEPMVDGGEGFPPDNELRLRVDVGEESFADEAAECAALADAGLTDHDVEGTRVGWIVKGLLPHVSSRGEGDLELDENGGATYPWTPIGEDKESHLDGVLNTAVVPVAVIVTREEIGEVSKVVKSLLTGGELGVAAPEVVAAYARFGPQLDQLLSPRAQIPVTITWHTPKPDKPDPSDPDKPDAPNPSEPGPVNSSHSQGAPTACPPASVIGTGFPTNAAGDPVTWERQDVDMSLITSLGKVIGIDTGIPQVPGALACLYQDPGAALPQIVPGLPLSRTTAIVGVLPTEKPMTDGAREVHMSGVKRAWFQQTLLWVVVDGWTLSVPSVSGSPDREKSALGIARAVVAWSR